MRTATAQMETTRRAAGAPRARPRVSPNRRREVGRMIFWNLVFAMAIVGLPILF